MNRSFFLPRQGNPCDKWTRRRRACGISDVSVKDTSRSSRGRDAAWHDTVRTAVNRLQDAQEELQRNAQHSGGD